MCKNAYKYLCVEFNLAIGHDLAISKSKPKWIKSRFSYKSANWVIVKYIKCKRLNEGIPSSQTETIMVFLMYRVRSVGSFRNKPSPAFQFCYYGIPNVMYVCAPSSQVSSKSGHNTVIRIFYFKW